MIVGTGAAPPTQSVLQIFLFGRLLSLSAQFYCLSFLLKKFQIIFFLKRDKYTQRHPYHRQSSNKYYYCVVK